MTGISKIVKDLNILIENCFLKVLDALKVVEVNKSITGCPEIMTKYRRVVLIENL